MSASQWGDIIVIMNGQQIAKASELPKAAGQSVRVWRSAIQHPATSKVNVTEPG